MNRIDFENVFNFLPRFFLKVLQGVVYMFYIKRCVGIDIRSDILGTFNTL